MNDANKMDPRFLTNEEFKLLEGQCDEIVKQLEVKHDERLIKFSEDVNRVLDYPDGAGANIEIELIKCHSALGRYTKYLAGEKHVFNIYKNKYDRFYAQCVDDAKLNPKMFRTVSELDGAVIRNTRIAKAKTFLDSYTEFIGYIEQSIENVKTKTYGLKAMIENRKILKEN